MRTDIVLNCEYHLVSRDARVGDPEAVGGRTPDWVEQAEKAEPTCAPELHRAARAIRRPASIRLRPSNPHVPVSRSFQEPSLALMKNVMKLRDFIIYFLLIPHCPPPLHTHREHNNKHLFCVGILFSLFSKRFLIRLSSITNAFCLYFFSASFDLTSVLR